MKNPTICFCVIGGPTCATCLAYEETKESLKLFRMTVHPCVRNDGTTADGCVMLVLGTDAESTMELVSKQQGYFVQPHAKEIKEVTGPFRHGQVLTHEYMRGTVI